MASLFKDELHEEFGTWPIAYIPYGGADFGEIQAVAEAIGEGDDDAYVLQWMSAGDRLRVRADEARAAGHEVTARALYLKASAFYGASLHPMYGSPVDPRLLDAFRRQRAAFTAGLALGPSPAIALDIPFQGTSMPGHFIPALGRESECRPLILFTNGYDATMPDMYFASAVAASRRGYHSLIFDGPGQGAMLYERGVALRPDWEVVIQAVVDFAVELSHVDPKRIALSGWSLGGYLAPRAASGESRLAALIADPGTWSIADGIRSMVIRQFGVPAEAARDLGSLDESVMERLDAFVRGDRKLRWKVVQRGYWVHGVEGLRDYLASAERFTMREHAALIRCRTLLTQAENDALASAAGSFAQALRCPATLMRFSAAEGAGGHCEMRNRSLLNDRVLDWLDALYG